MVTNPFQRVKLPIWVYSPFAAAGRRLPPGQSVCAALELGFSMEDGPSRPQDRSRTKKADVAEYPEVFRHVGLLTNEPPGTAGLPFI